MAISKATAEVISKIHIVLNLIKDFTVGYSTKSANEGYFILTKDNKVFKVHIEELGDVKDNNPIAAISEELKTLDMYVD